MGPRKQDYIGPTRYLDDYFVYVEPPWGNFEAIVIDSLTVGLLFGGWWFKQWLSLGAVGALRYYRVYQHTDLVVTASVVGGVYGTYIYSQSLPLALAGEFVGQSLYTVNSALNMTHFDD